MVEYGRLTAPAHLLPKVQVTCDRPSPYLAKAEALAESPRKRGLSYRRAAHPLRSGYAGL